MSLPLQLVDLHFLRPWWLAGLLLLPALAWWWRRRQRRRSAWQAIIDPHLLPHVLDTRGDARSRAGLWLLVLGCTLALLAMAGPSWRQSAQPLWQTRTPLVVALDLSGASLASDLPPSRLAQARAKLATLLRERRGGQVGLVVFAADAFTVAPLTDDAANVALFLDALQPDIMPRDGQRPAEAIAWSAELLRRAGATRGDILLLTDHADAVAHRSAAEAAAAGYRISVLGLGTEAGAAYKTTAGTIRRAGLDADSLRRLASEGQGRYRELSSDDADLEALGVLDPRHADAAGEDRGTLAWRDEGYWLLLPLMLVALLAFRRNSRAVLAGVLAIAAVLPRGAYAADLWRRPDQAAHARMQDANQAYRRGDYAAAAKGYEGLDGATAHYNRGNALAKAGQYEQAIAAYDQALKREPGMPDAIANKRAVQAAMQRRQQSGSDDGKSQQGKGDQSQDAGASGKQSQPAQGNGAAEGQPQGDPEPARGHQPDREQQEAPASSSPAEAPDPQEQAEADRAQRERIQRALEQQRAGASSVATQKPQPVQETPGQRERRLANEAWLRRVPDDPGGLLRAKFRLEYERRMAKGRSGQ